MNLNPCTSAPPSPPQLFAPDFMDAYPLPRIRYGSLVVLHANPKPRQASRPEVICKCDCGRTCAAVAAELIAGKLTKCGTCRRIDARKAYKAARDQGREADQAKTAARRAERHRTKAAAVIATLSAAEREIYDSYINPRKRLGVAITLEVVKEAAECARLDAKTYGRKF